MVIVMMLSCVVFFLEIQRDSIHINNSPAQKLAMQFVAHS